MLPAPRVEKYLRHRLYTDNTHGGLGLHSASWAGMCALIQLIQRALRLPDHKMPTQVREGHMARMVEWYRKILLSFGMEKGCLPKARSSVPPKAAKRPWDNYDHLFDEEDSDDARYDSLVPQRYLHSLQPKAGTSSLEVCTFHDGHECHQTGSPSNTTWYTDGNLLQERAGTGVVTGKIGVKALTPCPETISRAKMYRVWITATLAQPWDTILLNNRAVTKGVIHPWHLQSSDYDLHQAPYSLVIAKQLTIRWARGHRDPKKAHNLHDYEDQMGNELAHE